MPFSTTKFLESQVTARLSRVAAAAITVNRLVKIDSDYGKVIQTFTANTDCAGIGVAEATVASGGDVPIACGGILTVEASGTIVAGDELIAHTDGTVRARGTTATVLYAIYGRALTGAATGELLTMAWGPYTVPGANAS
jgi:hypothetical protein